MGASPQHFQLVADTVHTFTLDRDYAVVEVMNVDGTDQVTFTVNGAAPTVRADGAHLLPAVICSVELEPHTSGTTVVKAISAGTPLVSVRGVE